MESSESKNRLVKNEQMLRDKNTAVGNGLKNFFADDESIIKAPIAFMCECSRLDCDEHVNTSIELYEKLHKRKDRFTIFPGHSMPSLEKLITHRDEFDVVEKFELSS
jgi:hypothetical protein